jgi:hypothetical protein
MQLHYSSRRSIDRRQMQGQIQGQTQACVFMLARLAPAVFALLPRFAERWG